MDPFAKRLLHATIAGCLAAGAYVAVFITLAHNSQISSDFNHCLGGESNFVTATACGFGFMFIAVASLLAYGLLAAMLAIANTLPIWGMLTILALCHPLLALIRQGTR